LVKVKLDENLPAELKEPFLKAGHSVETVVEQGLGGKSDDEIFSVCRKENLTLVTLDMDFSDIRKYQPQTHDGIIVLRFASQDREHVVENVERFIPKLEEEPLIGKLWIVEESRVRIRGDD
jgi:predicted nuclease of predicted toxin-antitoxin system